MVEDLEKNAVKREFKVAFSKNAQPALFRRVKWTIFLTLVVWTFGTKWFWRFIGVLSVASFATHFFYRWKTKGWTQPFGGWKDIEAIRK